MSSDDRTPARLVLQRPDGEGLVYVLDRGQSVTLGRDAGNTIVLASKFVSKRHALVSWTPLGARIEDQDSANGIAINGLTVHAAELSSGDRIQIGDQHFVFEGEGPSNAAEPSGSVVAGRDNRKSKRTIATLLTVLVLAGGLVAAYVTFVTPALKRATPSGAALREDPSAQPGTAITPFDSPQAQAIELQAVAANDSRPAVWLFNEGQMAYKNGRLLDAYRLLNGALLRDPEHEASRRLLLLVIGERQERLNSLKAAAVHADEQRQFDEAARQWEAVQALTLDNEPLNARARTESARLRQRAAQ